MDPSVDSVSVVWVDNSGNEAGFQIGRRAADESDFSEVAILGSDETKFQDTGLSEGTLYRYRVRAFNSAGHSPYTSEVSVSTLTENLPPPTGASLVTVDASTQGNWKGRYGTEGHVILGDTSAIPGYVSLSLLNQRSYAWAHSTEDVRGLEKLNASDRVAWSWVGGSYFEVDVHLLDGQMHRIAFYSVDWDRQGRITKITAYDPESGAPFSTYTLSDFEEGKYLVYDVAGNVRFRFKTETVNAIAMGVFFGAETTVALPTINPAGGAFDQPVTVTLQSSHPWSLIRYTLDGSTPDEVSPLYSAPLRLSSSAILKARGFRAGLQPSETAVASFSIRSLDSLPAQAIFVGRDGGTRGTWTDKYGAFGYKIMGGEIALPLYAVFSGTGHSEWGWAKSTNDTRALLKSPVTQDRVAACWFSPSPFRLNLNLQDGDEHRVSFYLLDWDRQNRVQIMEVLDALTGAVLDTQTISNFQDGVYLTWDLAGDLQFRFTPQVHNAVVGGIFFAADSPVAQPVIFPHGGTFNGSISVIITTPTSDANLHYTLDGTTPTTNSPLYSAPFSLAQSATLTARAFKPGRRDSSMAAASFTIRPPRNLAPVLIPISGMSTNGFSFLLVGESGTRYSIQVSSNLSGWVDLFTVTNITATNRVSAPDSPLQGRSFFRARTD
jgi:hypothetical protein